jgi:hypothetical protein
LSHRLLIKYTYIIASFLCFVNIAPLLEKAYTYWRKQKHW